MAFASRRNFLKAGLAGTAAAAAAAVPAAAHAAKAPKAKELTYDVIVVGAGCAGLAATIEAADRGAKVLLIEKSAVPMGNTIYAGGFVNAACTWVQKRGGITDDLDSFYQDMMMVSKGRGDPELTKMYCEQSAGAVQWLTARCHLSWKKIPMQIKPMLGRSHQVDSKAGPGGSQMVENMMAEVEKLHVPMMFNTKVVELLHDDMLRCTGVKAVSPEGPLVIHAKGGVILATGGFGANHKMVEKYRPELKGFSTTNHPGATGDGIILAQQVGAGLTDIEQIQIHPTVIKKNGALISESMRARGGFLLNKNGKRFVSENEGICHITPSLASNPGGYHIVFMDKKIYDATRAKYKIGALIGLPSWNDERTEEEFKLGKNLFRANTLEEFCKISGVDLKGLQDQIEMWNKAVETKNDTQYGRHDQKVKIDTKGPFYGIKMYPWNNLSCGGFRVTDHLQVLGWDLKPVKGLYAAGETVAGVHGAFYCGGNACGFAHTSGYMAGQIAMGRKDV